MLKKKPCCPKCGSLDVVAIMYGYPMPETMAAAEKGLIELGGCCVNERDPRKHCKACGVDFDPRPSRAARRPGSRSETAGVGKPREGEQPFV
jgi:hypothetical protein